MLTCLYLLCTSQTSPPLYNIFLPPSAQLTSKVMSTMLNSVVFLALASVASVTGYSGGPPPSACKSMRPGPPHQVIFALEYHVFESVLKNILLWYDARMCQIILKLPMRRYAQPLKTVNGAGQCWISCHTMRNYAEACNTLICSAERGDETRSSQSSLHSGCWEGCGQEWTSQW